MNKLIKKISKTLSKAFGFVGMVMVIAAVAFTVPAALATHQASAPEWNTGTHADESNWFLVSNSTKGTGWGTSTTVSPGDVIAFRLYVHNNTCPENDAAGNDRDRCPATNARHTFVKVTVPSNGGTVTATIGSDNTGSNVSKTLNLTLPSGQTATYKAGSTQITQNKFNEFGWRMPGSTETVQGADNIATGLDLGDTPGCYGNARYIVFQVKVSNVSTPAVLGTTAKVLPSTGPETAPILALIGMIPTGIMLRRFKV